NAICEWVRGGGHLLLWPGEGPIPSPSSPLVNLLPCRIGDLTTVTFDDAVLRQSGLAQRFAKLKARALTQPAAGTEVIPIIEHRSPPLAVRGRRGLGCVTVVAFAAADLEFDNVSEAQSFW